MKRVFIISLCLLFSVVVFGQNAKIENGPMLGYSTLHEIMIWVQTTESAKVKIEYSRKDTSTKNFSEEIETKKEDAFTAHLLLDNLVEGTEYSYAVYLNGVKQKLPYETHFKTKEIWPYKTNPPAFSFTTGSGSFINEKKYDRPGKSYGGEYEIFNRISEKKPDFMIWGGDNIYLRQYEWESWTGTVHRYTHDRKVFSEMPLLANVHQYAIIDDHDFGPNDSDGSFPFKDMTTRAFQTFWANPPQVAGFESSTTFFSWYDADFFMLDNRYFRSTNYQVGGDKTILGKQQLEWLKSALVFSKAKFKFVVMGGQFLNSVPSFETYSNYGFNKEREEIIDFIYQQNIKNVIFITGDRHYTEISILKKRNQPDIIDLTFSPFTSGPNTHALGDPNLYRVEGTVVMKRNFGFIEISGDRRNRVMKVSSIGIDGEAFWVKEFEAK